MSDAVILKDNNTITVIEKENKKFYGIFTGLQKNARNLSRFANLKSDHGWIIHGDRLSPWQLTDTIAVEGKVYLCGDFQEGTSLIEYIETSSGKDISLLRKLVRDLMLLGEKGNPLSVLHTNGVLFLRNGDLLILPEKLLTETVKQSDEKEKLRIYEPFHHPELAGSPGVSFTLGTIAYRVLTGNLPFQGETDIEIHEKIREMPTEPPWLINVLLKKEIGRFILTAIDKNSISRPSLEKWTEELTTWSGSGTDIELSEDEKENRRIEAKRFEVEAKKKYARKRFLHRNRTKLLIGIIAGVAVIWLGTSILKNILAPPVTAGLTSREVVELYYTSINSLDTVTMEDCLDKNLDVQEEEEALNLHVITKIRQAYEGSSGFIDADTWVKSGRPPFEENQIVYGIAELKITKEKEDTFLVSYEKWQPGADSNKGVYHKDRVFLRNTGKYWVITGFEKIKEENL